MPYTEMFEAKMLPYTKMFRAKSKKKHQRGFVLIGAISVALSKLMLSWWYWGDQLRDWASEGCNQSEFQNIFISVLKRIRLLKVFPGLFEVVANNIGTKQTDS